MGETVGKAEQEWQEKWVQNSSNKPSFGGGDGGESGVARSLILCFRETSRRAPSKKPICRYSSFFFFFFFLQGNILPLAMSV